MAEANVSEVKRPNMFLFGCTLDTCKKVHRIQIDDDEADHQLSLKTVCLGAEAEDTFHTVEIEGMTYDGRMTKIPLAVLKPSVLPSLSLGGFEVTPPFTFRLLSGTGPVYISGQHFTSFKESAYNQVEEENNTSPVKRPSSMALGKVPQKKLKMDSDDDDDDEEEEEGEEDDSEDYEEDDSDDQDEDEKIDVAKTSFTFQQKAPEIKKSADKQNSSPGKKDDRAGKPQSQMLVKGNDRTGPGSSGKTPGKTTSINEVKNRLATAAKEGKSLPKTEQKFENYAKSSFKITDKQVIKDLWNFVQTLKK